ncbi:MAG TPA: heparan-alpha-glucosaminide N-acetyltransferase domain-containing protein [Chitinophagaceae bacterium]|nr:heparan-alpha-glucosaminide N-acetyltransferase domain-containing protein [Chitinophagaceae bacterium]
MEQCKIENVIGQVVILAAGIDPLSLTRGLWLIFADVVIVSVGWSFNSPPHFMSFGVVSAIGMSLIILSLLIHLPYKLILAFGITVIALHNCLDNIHFTEGSFAQFIWSLIHERKIFKWGDGYTFSASYLFLAWAGVMAAGYCLGAIFKPGFDSLKRKYVLRYTGLFAIVLFFALRYFNLYDDPSHWQNGATATQTVMLFFNVQKYPPSLLFLLATLEPVLLCYLL